ncbi:hypothetical protein DF182_07735 [Chitinophaga flava]|uniref:Uncharacterized protein n=2 Tax=Chitinophaga flava TaxID=2259036 RepID=A0A365Y1F3_9BACT|nr:hypothetical protein DF182_07735 [Chitinophaga flava]
MSIIILCYSLRISAQSLTAPPVTVNYTTYSQLNSTQTATNRLTLTGALAVTVSLSIKASGPLISTTVPSNTIPLSNVTAQLTDVNPTIVGMAVPSSVLTLTTNNQAFGTGLLSLATTHFTISYNIAGGSNLMVPPGTYVTTLTYTVTNTLGLFPTTTGTALLSVVISPMSGIALQNGGSNATIAFTTSANYTNGVTLQQANALSAFSNLPYSITANTSSASLANGTNFINVSNISLLSTPVVTNPLITSNSIALSTSSQNIITSTAVPGVYNFNLQYQTAPGNTAFLMPAGNYTNTLTYTITNP